MACRTRDFLSLRARFVPDAKPDPYTVLGVTPDMPIKEIRKVWRRLVRETHPDRDDRARRAGRGDEAGRKADGRHQPRLGRDQRQRGG